MTDTPSERGPAAVWQGLLAAQSARTALAEQALPGNKTALFNALAAAGITSVIVAFDGVGDSGQVESIDAYIKEVDAPLPTVAIEIATPQWDGSTLQRRTLPMREAIEELAYAFLEETHDGWEINEGAFGEFTFDVAERAITLDYNERVESSTYSGHAW